LTAKQRLEALARAIHDGDEGDGIGWNDHSDQVRGWHFRRARAACEHIFGKDADGNLIVPEPGAVAKAREALQRTCDACRLHRDDKPPCDECDIGDALRLLGGK